MWGSTVGGIMTPPAAPERYQNHRFPGELIRHGVWLYYRVPLSYRDVQELLCERGIDVTHEAICQGCRKLGQDDAHQLKHRRAQPGDKWYLDEVFLTMSGERHDLWHAVDQDENVLDILVQSRRNQYAATRFFRKLLKGLRSVPRVIMTEKLKSYDAATRASLPGVEHRQSRYLKNRCENSHRPTRQREYRMQGFTSAGQAQRFLSAYGPIAHHFRPRRHLLSAAEYCQEMKNRFESWAEITGMERAA
jgi:putative transposase